MKELWYPGLGVPWPEEPEFQTWVRDKLIQLTDPPTLTWCRIDPEGPGLHEPKRDGDIGWDLEASETVRIGAGGQKDIPTNIRIQLPPHCWGEIRSRSSIAKRNLIVPPTVLDNGYTGPIFVLLYNANLFDNGTMGATIEKGERVAQLVVHHGVWCRSEEVESVPDDPRRGSAGFGSTGR